MAVFFCILSGILTGGFGLYFVGWEIVNLQFDEFFVSGIFLCIISFVCFFLSYRIHKTNKEIKAIFHQEKQTVPPPDIRPHDPFPNAIPKQPEVLKLPEQPKAPARPVPARPNLPKEPMKSSRPLVSTASVPAIQVDSQNRMWFCKHQYQDGVALFDVTAESLRDKLSKIVTFKPEPENASDPDAVAVYIDNLKIGYLYRTCSFRRMTVDYLTRGDLFGAYIYSIDPDNNKVIIKASFCKLLKNIDSKMFPLIKTSKLNYFGVPRSENLISCKSGDIVEVCEDPLDGYMAVSCNGKEIGELGSAFRKWAEENDYDKFGGIIESIEEEDEKYKVMLKIYGA